MSSKSYPQDENSKCKMQKVGIKNKKSLKEIKEKLRELVNFWKTERGVVAAKQGDQKDEKIANMTNSQSQRKIFCAICKNEKSSRFCSNCQKETPNLYKEPLSLEMKSKISVSGSVKRGDISWAYFPIAYGIILTIVVGIIQLFEIINWCWRILLIIVLGILFFYLCFFNDFFRNKIVWLFTKSKEHKEKI